MFTFGFYLYILIVRLMLCNLLNVESTALLIHSWHSLSNSSNFLVRFLFHSCQIPVTFLKWHSLPSFTAISFNDPTEPLYLWGWATAKALVQPLSGSNLGLQPRLWSSQGLDQTLGYSQGCSPALVWIKPWATAKALVQPWSGSKFGLQPLWMDSSPVNHLEYLFRW